MRNDKPKNVPEEQPQSKPEGTPVVVDVEQGEPAPEAVSGTVDEASQKARESQAQGGAVTQV